MNIKATQNFIYIIFNKIYVRITQTLLNWRLTFTDFLQYFLIFIKVKRFNHSFLREIAKSSKVVMIDGNDHEIIWAIRWGLIQSWLMRKGYRPVVLARKKLANRNRYYKLFGCKNFCYIDTFFNQKKLPDSILNQIDEILSSCDIKKSLLSYTYNDLPIGKITLSGYARGKKRGDVMNFDCSNLKFLHKIFTQNMKYAYFINEFLTYLPDVYITSESFHDEHGVFYHHMLNKGVNIIRMNISSMDDCVLIQRRKKSREGIHHSTVTPETFYNLLKSSKVDDIELNKFVEDNFADRYSDKWHLCKRNFPNVSDYTRAQLIKEYNLDSNKKIVTVFSHILYDTLFFFEKEIYDTYAEWLIDTVAAAIKNPDVNWLIKIHPSNAWREELYSHEYEELRLIHDKFGDQLPEHIKFVLPEDNIHPLSLIKHSDVGVTVRGTVGMEMPCLGNQVITAASGRYSGLGFTNDPKSKSEYLEILSKVSNLPRLSNEQVRMAKIYYHAIFRLKPTRLSDLKPVLRMGYSKVGLLGGLHSTLRGNINLNAMGYQPEIIRFLDWVENSEEIDFFGVEY